MAFTLKPEEKLCGDGHCSALHRPEGLIAPFYLQLGSCYLWLKERVLHVGRCGSGIMSCGLRTSPCGRSSLLRGCRVYQHHVKHPCSFAHSISIRGICRDCAPSLSSEAGSSLCRVHKHARHPKSFQFDKEIAEHARLQRLNIWRRKPTLGLMGACCVVCSVSARLCQAADLWRRSQAVVRDAAAPPKADAGACAAISTQRRCLEPCLSMDHAGRTTATNCRCIRC